MTRESLRITVVALAAVVVAAMAQGPAAAQETGAPVIRTGTTLRFEGVEARLPACQQYEPYEQYTKFAGRVILPETEANVYDFIESWGRDSGIGVIRITPSGDAFVYDRGVERKFLVNGPVGTWWEFTDPESGMTLRYVVVADDISLRLPTGVTYRNTKRVNIYCTDCGPQWALQESFWVSPELGFQVLLMTWDAENQCAQRWLWLVSVTRK